MFLLLQVIVGNNRCSLTGKDLNRQYRTVIRETYPPVWHTKVMIRRYVLNDRWHIFQFYETNH